MNTFRQRGHTRQKTVPTGGVSSGDVNVLRSGSDGEIGIWIDDYAAAVEGTLAVSGVHVLPKATGTGTGLDPGDRVYWDTGDTEVNESATGNTKAGTVHKAAAVGDATVEVLINDRPSD